MQRRSFLQKAAMAGAFGSVLHRTRPTALADTNSQIRLALIGCGSRGNQLVGGFGRNSKFVAVCDVDKDRAEKAKNDIGADDAYIDFRAVLDRDDIDGVVIATPNHTHGLITILACQAGKDVYVEKPVSHNILEGRLMIEAANKHQRIVQAGTQNLSDTAMAPAREYYQSGKLGKLLFVHCFWYNARDPIGKVKHPTPVPASVDYNLFQGPRPLVPLMRANFHYDWHWQWPTGNGEIGNVGLHVIDHTRSLLNIPGLPRSIACVGGRLGWDDDGETPNTHLVAMDYGEVPFTFEVRDLPASKDRKGVQSRFRERNRGTIVVGENGMLFFNRGGGQVFDNDGKRIENFGGDGGGNHANNWLDCMRSRRPQDLVAPLQESHYSTTICHMANINYRVGTRGFTAADTEDKLPDLFHRSPEVLKNLQEHLAANEIDFKATPLTIGPVLEIDRDEDKFIENNDFAVMANYLRTDTYRAPFTLPE